MADHDFPTDLIQLRRDFHQAGRDLAALPDDAPRDQRQALRDHERDLALQLSRHPYWTAEPGNAEGREALQQMIADEFAAAGDADRS